ncbi:hypothetical protein SS50377_20047 [Spironucleus salmonicida]|uniref:Uncharacterized protein n=1 Tax=Spironucleus salmonicida TaxID=348837 RepID=V6M7G3_9EUKA|nr:hypothetical protein SS50377_20047 [Spironucleus salmonicida]|eukprot:EST49384.1 Hypothetical protein SS50377_10309 [Spironucleus salmonicida]
MSKDNNQILLTIYNTLFEKNIKNLEDISLPDEKDMKKYVKLSATATHQTPIYTRKYINNILQKHVVKVDPNIQIQEELCIETEARLQKRFVTGSPQSAVYLEFQDVIKELKQEFSLHDQKFWASCYFKMQKVLEKFVDKNCRKSIVVKKSYSTKSKEDTVRASKINLDAIVGSLDLLDQFLQ